MTKNIVFRRFVAYLLDFVIVAGIASCLSYIPFINPSKDVYEATYNEVMDLYKSYEKHEISDENYKEQYVSSYYDLNRLNFSYMVINLTTLLAYFGIFQWIMDGQTLGKRIMRLRVVSKDDSKDVSCFSFLIRSIILNNIVITVLQLCVLFLYPVNQYYMIYSNINMVGYVLNYVILFLLLVRVDHRGLHDLIASTKVVSLDDVQEEVVEEASFVEVKPESKSSRKKNRV